MSEQQRIEPFDMETFGNRIGVILDVEFTNIRLSVRQKLHKRVCDIAEVIAKDALLQEGHK